MKKRKNYKLFIGLIVGIAISVSGVFATSSIGTASDIDYNNSTSGLMSSNVQDAIDELWEMKDCPSKTYCVPYKYNLSEGDYVYYKPTVTSYPVDTSMTGYTGTVDQTIYPEELELWRVLNINSDGTIDLISEYVSSTNVYFVGQKGYLNFVGYLNVLAKQYETEEITAGSRCFGFNGQTEYIEDTDPTSIFVKPAPYTCSTGGTCNPDPDDNENKGGGDTLYVTDFDRTNTVLGTRIAYKVDTTTATSYWMASRDYYYSSSNYRWRGRVVLTLGGMLGHNDIYYYNSGNFYSGNKNSALRPIVTMKSGLTYEGLGTKEVPMKIINN